MNEAEAIREILREKKEKEEKGKKGSRLPRGANMGMASILVLSLAAFTQLTLIEASLSASEANRLCRERTGLKDGDIRQYHTRNQNCALDCETKQGTLMTAHADDGTACNDQEGYKCVMGVCRGEDNRSDEQYKSMKLNLVSLGFRSARVADRDPYPGQGESDAFVVAEIVSEGKPNYNDGEVICHTHVVQDSSRPKWNFACRPLALKSTARLRFVVMDSDKPDTQAQLLGQTTQTLETLLNAGPQTLILDLPKALENSSSAPYWLEVEVKGKRYTPGE